MRDFGMLGKSDEVLGAPLIGGGGLGISERMIDSLIKNFAKSLERQMNNFEGDTLEDKNVNAEIQRFPNGISIRIGGPVAHKHKEQKKARKVITDEQINRMAKLPRSDAKADVRRFSDKVVYEVKAPGIENIDDIFVSKLENGYEVKAIGKNKVYVANIPVNLPLRGYGINEKGLNVEFGLG